MQLESSLSFDKMYDNGKQFINNIIKKKYCLDNENNYDDIVNRVERELKKYHENRIIEIDKIVSMLRNKRYIPGGSIMFGLGTKIKSSLSNCYFLPIKHDSIEGIYECKKELARVFSYRGGAGIDISILRPANSVVNNSCLFSSGAVSFLPEFSETARTIGQNGRRANCGKLNRNI